MNRRSLKEAPFLVIGIVLCCLLLSVVQGHGDGYKGEKHGIRGAYENAFKKGDRGNETTGEIAAWMFGLANVPVALSIVLKTLARFLPTGMNLRDPLTKFNRRQKKVLMTLHYWLNPIALGVALSHFTLSTCRSTAFPEWGLGIMLTAVLLGLTMKFKWSPVSVRQHIFRLHTSPILLIAAVLVLLIGHTIVDS